MGPISTDAVQNSTGFRAKLSSNLGPRMVCACVHVWVRTAHIAKPNIARERDTHQISNIIKGGLDGAGTATAREDTNRNLIGGRSTLRSGAVYERRRRPEMARDVASSAVGCRQRPRRAYHRGRRGRNRRGQIHNRRNHWRRFGLGGDMLRRDRGRMYVCMYLSKYACINVSMDPCIHVSMHLCIYVSMVCLHLCLCM